MIEEVQGGVHLEGYDSRKEFVLAICSEKVKPSLVQCIVKMIIKVLRDIQGMHERKEVCNV